MESNRSLTHLPELNIDTIKETLLKSGVTFFNLQRMEKGYYPTSLIKFQVDKSKAHISYLRKKPIRIGDSNYIIRRDLEKPRQDYSYRCCYRYVKPHHSTRFMKQSRNAETITNIEPKVQSVTFFV